MQCFITIPYEGFGFSSASSRRMVLLFEPMSIVTVIRDKALRF